MQFLEHLFSRYQDTTSGDKRISDEWMTCAPCVWITSHPNTPKGSRRLWGVTRNISQTPYLTRAIDQADVSTTVGIESDEEGHWESILDKYDESATSLPTLQSSRILQSLRQVAYFYLVLLSNDQAAVGPQLTQLSVYCHRQELWMRFPGSWPKSWASRISTLLRRYCHIVLLSWTRWIIVFNCLASTSSSLAVFWQ